MMIMISIPVNFFFFLSHAKVDSMQHSIITPPFTATLSPAFHLHRVVGEDPGGG